MWIEESLLEEKKPVDIKSGSDSDSRGRLKLANRRSLGLPITSSIEHLYVAVQTNTRIGVI